MENGGSVEDVPRIRAERTEDTELRLRLPTLRRLMRTFLPDEVLMHLYAAQREQLLAIRAVLDAAIERTEDAERDAHRRTVRRRDIRVE